MLYAHLLFASMLQLLGVLVRGLLVMAEDCLDAHRNLAVWITTNAMCVGLVWWMFKLVDVQVVDKSVVNVQDMLGRPASFQC